MKKRIVVLGIFLAGIVFFSVYWRVRYIFGRPLISITPAAPAIPTASAVPVSAALESQIDNQGEVSVSVQPIKIEPNAPWQFAISLDTHSVELDDDLIEQAVLYDDQSQIYKPTGWTGSEPSGHHRSGSLTFASIDPMPKYIEFIIKDVSDIPLRTFRWDLK